MVNLNLVKPLAITFIAAMLIVSLSLGFTQVQAQEPKIVKFEVDKTSVYMGYQGVEIKVYIYAPSRPTITTAKATLTAGLQITVDLSLVELQEATTVTVGNVTYSVKYIVLGRVMIPNAVYPGTATLAIEVSGRVGTTTFSNSTTYRITILGSRFVEEERMSAFRALERVSTIVSIATAIGVDTSNLIKALDEIESMIKEADDKLLTLGAVEEANEMYKKAKLKTEEVYSTVMIGLMETSSEYTNKLNGLLDYTNKLSLALVQYSNITNDAIESLVNNINKLAKQQEDSSKNINNALNSISNSLQSLNNKVDSVAKNQNDVVNAFNGLQIAVTVMGVAVIVAVALMGLRFRK
ncbi:MAG: hypothetical protein QW775_06605 [Ignisphaera sp.]|uniref:Uncharacterized protein n=1 Tax=Ignisphaera aggregans TaxID=334771 RepID=A0A7C4NN35_9CREN